MVDNIESDVFSPPMKWRKVDELPKKIGYLKEFNILPVSQANQRAMDISINILKKKGVEMVEVDWSDLEEELILLTFASFFSIPALSKLV